MLCCGLLALITAGIAGSWRRLGTARWIVPTVAVALLAIPAVASGAGRQAAALSPADVAAQTMRMLCQAEEE